MKRDRNLVSYLARRYVHPNLFAGDLKRDYERFHPFDTAEQALLREKHGAQEWNSRRYR